MTLKNFVPCVPTKRTISCFASDFNYFSCFVFYPFLRTIIDLWHLPFMMCNFSVLALLACRFIKPTHLASKGCQQVQACMTWGRKCSSDVDILTENGCMFG